MSNPHDSKAKAHLGEITIYLEPGGKVSLIAHGRPAAVMANDLLPMLRARMESRMEDRPWHLASRHASTVETLDWLLEPFGAEASPAELVEDDEIPGGDVED